VEDPQFTHYRYIAELPPHVLSEVKRFFLDYKVLEDRDVAIDTRRPGRRGEP
jgi:inorganic pyrophosphatase